MINDNTPIIIGAGVVCQHAKDPERAPAPIDLLSAATAKALQDAGIPNDSNACDAVSALCFVMDAPDSRLLPVGNYTNPGFTIAKRLGLGASKFFLSAVGGNSPQYTISNIAERIANGEVKTAVVVGGEALDAVTRVLENGIKRPDWNDTDTPEPIKIGTQSTGVNATESAHNMLFPVNVYPLFETAIRHRAGLDHKTHGLKIGKLMAPFSRVAAGHDTSWFPVERTPEEIATPGPHNRWIGYPYTKYMNAVMRVNQAAALVMTSVGEARARNIAPENWVYLHGCAELNDIWHVSERLELDRSPAIRAMSRAAFDMAGWTINDLDYLDIYSCFPSAVQVACHEMNIPLDDPRGLTITGGLPYFGGAGNAYALISLAMMQAKLRAKPGSKGMCTGNGWFLTKHSLGMYSTTPFEGTWRRPNLNATQNEIDTAPKYVVEPHPNGGGVIDSYAIPHPSGKSRFGLIIGRLDDQKTRFVAHIPDENDWLDNLMYHEGVGIRGQVVAGDNGINIFSPTG